MLSCHPSPSHHYTVAVTGLKESQCQGLNPQESNSQVLHKHSRTEFWHFPEFLAHHDAEGCSRGLGLAFLWWFPFFGPLELVKHSPRALLPNPGICSTFPALSADPEGLATQTLKPSLPTSTSSFHSLCFVSLTQTLMESQHPSAKGCLSSPISLLWKSLVSPEELPAFPRD